MSLTCNPIYGNEKELSRFGTSDKIRIGRNGEMKRNWNRLIWIEIYLEFCVYFLLRIYEIIKKYVGLKIIN